MRCLTPQRTVRWVETDLLNLLHEEGERYLLSAGFATNLPGYGPAPSSLYLGIDNRVTVERKQTLAQVVEAEPPGYKRIPLRTAQDFFPLDDPTFALALEVQFVAEADMGMVRNAFLCTAPSGSTGRLLVSVPLRRARPMFEQDTLTFECQLSLQQNLAS